MLPPRYSDPLGSRLPALERNMLKLRAIHMVLILFYVEEIKRKARDLIQATDSLHSRFPGSAAHVPIRVPKGSRQATEKALAALVADGALTKEEKTEIEDLIKYRNDIGHRVHDLVADLSPESYVREMRLFSDRGAEPFDFQAVDRVRKLSRRLGNAFRTHHYVTTINMNALMFEAAERVFLDEAKRLERKIAKLHKFRATQVDQLNVELSSACESQTRDDDMPDHPQNRHDNGRLTPRGVEVCYRLYDAGRSPMAVAHLMRMRLPAALRRKAMWEQAGGQKRPHIDIALLPRRKFYRRYDD